MDRYGLVGVAEAKDEAVEYLQGPGHAVAWAALNRALIAERFLDMLGTNGKPIIDLCHNSICPVQWNSGRYWLHRKGAAPSDAGAVVLPRSRGTLTYLLEPDRKSTRLNSSHIPLYRMPSSA